MGVKLDIAGWGSRWGLSCAILMLFCTLRAEAEPLPEPAQLQLALGEPASISVFEPNLALGDAHTAVEYMAYPATRVFNLVFGEDWRDWVAAIEFRALDGYVSRVERERFDRYPAYLAFARADGTEFAVDVPGQNQTDVPLGPYYLVWDNRQHPELLIEGGRYWPYQVDSLEPFHGFGEVLTPATLAPRLLEGARLAQSHCLSCHQIRGVGGMMFPIDLSQVVSTYEPDAFSRWLLEPAAVKPGTHMPPLAPRVDQSERERMAEAIYDYLQALR
jgi:hypothetical protein